MSDKNPTRARHAANKRAFTDVMGDPFATEDLEGHYNVLKRRGAVSAMKTNFDEGKATRNPGSPNLIDFFCDVDNAVKDVITDKKVLNKFRITYIVGDIESAHFTQAERNRLEQLIGKLFRVRKISPVSRYFTTIRRPIYSGS